MTQKTIKISMLISTALFFILTACSNAGNIPPTVEPSRAQPSEAAPSASENIVTKPAPSNTSEGDSPEAGPLSLTVGSHSFTVSLEDNEAARAFVELLPLTLDMSELNGNEKYYYMDTSLPTNAENPGRINAGDLMLYGDNCLVLFFDSFSTAYSYTRLGSVDDADALTSVLDSGTVTVTFELSK